MATVEYVWVANLRGRQGARGIPGIPGEQGPPVPAEQLAAAVETALAATGRLSNYGVAVGTGSPLTDLDALPNESGFYRAFSTALNRPPGFTGTVLHLAYLSTSAMQVGVPVGSTTPTGLWVRVKREGVFGDWQQVPTLAEVTTLLDSLDLVNATELTASLDPVLAELAGRLSAEALAEAAAVVANAEIDRRDPVVYNEAPVSRGNGASWRVLDDGRNAALGVSADGLTTIAQGRVEGDLTVVGNIPSEASSSRVLDSAGTAAFAIGEHGEVWVGATEVRPSLDRFMVRDAFGNVAFAVLPDGSVFPSAPPQSGELRVEDYGTVLPARYLTDVSMTAGSAALTSTSYAFTSDDVGKTVGVRGAGVISTDYMTLANDGVLVGTIVGVAGGVATLSVAAVNTLTGGEAAFGVPIDVALAAALNAASALGGRTVVIPAGVYVASASTQIPSRCSVRGAGRGRTLVYVVKISTSKTSTSAAWLREGAWEADNYLHNVNLSDFSCDGRFFAATHGYSYEMKMIHISSTRNSSARRLGIFNNPATALGYDNSTNCVLEENIIVNFARLNVVDPTSPAGGSGGSGIGTATGGRGGAVSIIIRNNFIQGNWTAAGGAGHACILIEAASNTPAPGTWPAAVIIEGNILQGGFTGITDSGGSDTKILGNDISACAIGIYLGNNAVPKGMVARDAIIANNTVRDGVTAAGYACVGLLITTVTGAIASEGRTLVTGNIFRTGDGVGVLLDATVSPLFHMHLMGNAIRDNDGRGLVIMGVFYDLMVVHQQISGNGRGGAQTEAIFVAPGSTWTDGSLIGNSLTDYAATPTQTNSYVTAGATLTGVTISGNTGDN
ncbi:MULTISPECIES: hypothetical protein [unclassified Microbacterium]|uniref:hypothetical protein n=1 Tax=unclassified Microbacterium TaxID=2609290 RepID=UPI00301A941B